MKEFGYITPTESYVAEEIISKTEEYITLAFSNKSRQEILRRDGYKCVMCGATDHLEAAHIDHKRNSNYDNPSNGKTLCTEHHLQDHLSGRRNGLSRRHNNWAIERLRERVESQKRWQQPILPL